MKTRQRINLATGHAEWYCHRCLAWKPATAFTINPKKGKPYPECKLCRVRQEQRKRVRR